MRRLFNPKSAGPGLEPRYSPSKGDVLPLDDPAICKSAIYSGRLSPIRQAPTAFGEIGTGTSFVIFQHYFQRPFQLARLGQVFAFLQKFKIFFAIRILNLFFHRRSQLKQNGRAQIPLKSFCIIFLSQCFFPFRLESLLNRFPHFSPKWQ